MTERTDPRPRPAERFTPFEQIIWRALLRGDQSIDDLIDELYAGPAGGPISAREVVVTLIWRLRSKTSRRITRHIVYRME